MKEKPQDKSECLKRAAEVRRFARETGDPAEKADLFSVERRWRMLGEPSEEEMESWIDMPRARASHRKNRSALSHGVPAEKFALVASIPHPPFASLARSSWNP
jgi:hypothetical protein